MHKTIKFLTPIVLAAALAGCSSLPFGSKKSATTVSGASATEITSESKPTVATVEPTHQEPASEQENQSAAPAQTMGSSLALSLGGEWTIFQVGPVTIDRDEDMPYIIFEPSTGRFYANNGCNTINGAYSVNGDFVEFSNVLSTMRLCPDVEFEQDINAVITEGIPVEIKITEGAQESYLDLITPDGHNAMRLRRGNMQFLNGQWDVESITGLDKLEVPANIFFDLGELRLHGNTGCNIVNGSIYLDHRLPNAVDFSNMGTTRMACPFDRQQTAMLVALQEASAAISDGNERVIFLNPDGKVLMTLVKASSAGEEQD